MPACARPRPYRLHGVLQDEGELGEHPVPGLQQLLPGRPRELLDPPPPPLLRLPGPLQSEGRCGRGGEREAAGRPGARGVRGRRGAPAGAGTWRAAARPFQATRAETLRGRDSLRLGHGGSPARVPSARSARLGLQGAPSRPGEPRQTCPAAGRTPWGAEARGGRGPGGSRRSAAAALPASGRSDPLVLTFLKFSQSQCRCRWRSHADLWGSVALCVCDTPRSSCKGRFGRTVRKSTVFPRQSAPWI